MAYETRTVLTERYAKFGARPGSHIYKFVYHAPTNTMIIGTAGDTQQGLYSALKNAFGFRAKRGDLAIGGVFNRKNNHAFVILNYKPEEHAGHVAAIARVLKSEAAGKFTIHSVAPEHANMGAWHFDIRHPSKMVTIGKVEDVAEGRTNR